VATGPDDAIYVGDSGIAGSGSLIKLDATGQIQGTIVSNLHTPVGVAVDRSGQVWVAEANRFVVGQDKILGFDANSAPVGSLAPYPEVGQPVGMEFYIPPSPPNEVATPPGSEIAVSPVVTLPGGGTSTTTVEMTFESVETAGVTTVSATSTPSGGASGSPPGFKAGTPPVYYDVSTTASFSGSVNLCFSWQEGQYKNENNIELFHFENGDYVRVTTSRDTFNNKVCGQVTSLSPFAIFETSYSFTGFFAPVDNFPTRNTVKAGSGVPVKFSLNGDQGLAIMYSGYPLSQPMACTSGTPSDTVDETLTAGSSSLSYDAASDMYTYIWKTNKSWAKSCRRLIVKLSDGSEHTADFGFVK